jgi:hypothetical protein
MLDRATLRRAMVRPDRDRLTGWVEVDETYLGGLEEGAAGRGVEEFEHGGAGLQPERGQHIVRSNGHRRCVL